MRLSELRPKKGSRKPKRIRGRGGGSGRGNFSGRGIKGQKSRSGNHQRPGWAGGMTPLIRQTPKYGFTNIFRKERVVVNVETLNRFKKGSIITPELLKDQGMVKQARYGIKILGQGELKKALTVKAQAFSQLAKKKIVDAGGTAEVISL